MAGKNQKGPCPFSDYSHSLEVLPSIYTMAAASLQDTLYGSGANAWDAQQLLSGRLVQINGKGVQVLNRDGRLRVLLQGQKAVLIERQL